MKKFNTLEEMLSAVTDGTLPELLLKEQLSVFDQMEAELPEGALTTAQHVEYLISQWPGSKEENTFEWLFGGALYVCETEEDLKEIEGCDMDWAEAHEDKWPSVVDLPMSWDHCGYVGEDAASGWFVFLLCWNNAGGPIYYVPQPLWESARVVEHLAAHAADWKLEEFTNVNKA